MSKKNKKKNNNKTKKDKDQKIKKSKPTNKSKNKSNPESKKKKGLVGSLKSLLVKRRKKKKKKDSKKQSEKKMNRKPVMLLGLPFKKALLLWTGVVLLILFGGLFFIFKDQVLLALPGFYENAEYNELTVKKNDLIDVNAELFNTNTELNGEINELGGTSEDFTKRIEKNKQILSNLETIEDNMNTIMKYDDSFKNMRLPHHVSRYVEISSELDKIRLNLIQIYEEYINARIDMNILNKKRTEFDECLTDINWNGKDSDIAKAIDKCRNYITEIQAQLQVMEDNYGVELTGLTNYFTLLSDQWEASSEYYKALAANDYKKATAHDETFSEKKREISEIDVEVFNEFDNKVIDDLKKEFEKLSEEEVSKEEEANDWYDEYIER